MKNILKINNFMTVSQNPWLSNAIEAPAFDISVDNLTDDQILILDQNIEEAEKGWALLAHYPVYPTPSATFTGFN